MEAGSPSKLYSLSASWKTSSHSRQFVFGSSVTLAWNTDDTTVQMKWQYSSLHMHRWRQRLTQYTKHSMCGKSTRKGKCTTDASTESSRILVISWEDVLYLVYVLLDTRDDHTRWGRLQTRTGMEVATSRNVNARCCTLELPSCPKQVQNMLQLLPCAHQYDIRLRAKHFATKAAVFCKCCSCSILQVVQDDRHWRNVTKRHYGSTHIYATTFLTRQLPIRWFRRGGFTSWSTRSPISTPWTFSSGASWKIRFAFLQYTQSWTGTIEQERLQNSRAFVAKCLARSRTSSWCVRGEVGEWNTN